MVVIRVSSVSIRGQISATDEHGSNTDSLELLAHGETTSRIIGAAFEVHNILGCGFLEKVYQRAMQVELIKRKQRSS
jgi:hypothetical protein